MAENIVLVEVYLHLTSVQYHIGKGKLIIWLSYYIVQYM